MKDDYERNLESSWKGQALTKVISIALGTLVCQQKQL
jgi:hypothetical protein